MALVSASGINPWNLPSCALSEIGSLPSCRGIYFVIGKSDVYYIGKTSVSFKARWDAHHRLKDLVDISDARIAWLELSLSNDDLVLIESELIDAYRPPLNKGKSGFPPICPPPDKSEYLLAVKAANKRLKGFGIPIRLSVHRNSLYLRSSRLPARPGRIKNSASRDEIARGPLSWIVIKAAERDAHRMWAATINKRFKWEDYPAYQRS